MIFVYDPNRDRDLTASMLARNPNFKVSVDGKSMAATKVRLPKSTRNYVHRSPALTGVMRAIDKALSS